MNEKTKEDHVRWIRLQNDIDDIDLVWLLLITPARKSRPDSLAEDLPEERTCLPPSVFQQNLDRSLFL